MAMSKKRQADNDDPLLRRANKRRAACGPPTTVRMTRSAYKKLITANDGMVQLNPGLPMETCRQKNSAAAPQTASLNVATAPPYALGITSDGRQVHVPMKTDNLSSLGSQQGTGEAPVALCEPKVKGRPSDAALVSYALGGTPDGRQVCMPLTPDASRTPEAQQNLVLPHVADVSAQRAPVLTQAANAGGPAPVAYMGGSVEEFPVQPGAWEVICAAYTASHSSTNPDHGGIQQLRTCSMSSDCSSLTSPLTGVPVTCCPPLHPSAIPDFSVEMVDAVEEVEKKTPNPYDVFDPSWSFFKFDSTELTVSKEAKKVLEEEEEDQTVSAVLKATYSLSPEYATELMFNERILQEYKDYSKPLIVEVPCSPSPISSSRNRVTTNETVAETDSASGGNLLEQSVTEQVVDRASLSITEREHLQLGDLGQNSTKQGEEEPGPFTTEVKSAPHSSPVSPTLAKVAMSANVELIPKVRSRSPGADCHKRMAEQDVSGADLTDLMQVVYHPKRLSMFPPWPYTSRMPSWSTDEGQYSIETYEEDSVIY